MKGFWKDISWIEFCILLGVLASILVLTIPNYELFSCRSLQSEARFTLSHLLSVQKLYESENGKYAELKELVESNRVKINSTNYHYSSGVTSKGELWLRATGKTGTPVPNDTWETDKSGQIISIHNQCKG